MRGKFIIASILVGLILVLSSTASYLYINRSSDDVAQVLEQRLEKLNETRVIMDNIWDVSFFLEEHSIAPTDSAQSLIFSKMVTSVNRILYLIEKEEGNERAVEKLQIVLDNLGQLGIYISHLLELRSTPAKLFPAIEVSRSSMFQSQNTFAHLAGLSINEALSVVDESGIEVLELLIKLRYQWSQMISFYRMYLVNRLALMDRQALHQQVANIDLFVTSISETFKKLELLDRRGDLEFETSDAIPAMKKALRVWISSFKKIVSTETPEEWRTDYPVIKTKVAPLMKNIWESILDYNRGIELDLKQSLFELSGVASNIGYMLWGFTAFGLTVILVLFYFVHMTLLKPVHKISTAMRAEARDGRYLKPLLLKGRSLEIQNLIDAFSTMQLQVHSRKNDLEHQALHDNLTALPNRLLLFDRLQQAITKQRRARGSLSLIMMDLDRFKEINDTLGHHAGDELLQIVSKRLSDCLRGADTVARLGGDEFAILIPDCDADQSKKIALKVRECMQPAIQLYEQSLYIHGSLGIANYPEHGADAETLLKNADIAMYQAKRNNTLYEVYDYEQDQHSVNRLALKHELQKAIENNQLELFYQPQINCKHNNVVGAEALLRWKKQNSDPVSPAIFIPLAEESGLIKLLTEWVIIEAIKQQRLWQAQAIDMHISINLSAWNLLDPELDSLVEKFFHEYEVKKGRISFEITESVMMTDTEQALKMMNKLNALGSDLIVDDFGTGFSSLAYLKKFPVNELKIDQSFIKNMVGNENDSVIVKSTIDLAHNLGLKVVAEGVETEEVFEVLRMLGCDMVQGFYISRPAPANEFIQWYHQFQSTGS